MRGTAEEIVWHRAWAYHALGRAGLRLGRLDAARRLADRAIESSSSHPGYAAHALHLFGDIATHPDRFDPESGEAHYRQAPHEQTAAGAGAPPPTTMYREMEMTYWLEQAEAELRERA